MELVDLSLIKPMLVRSLEDPEAIRLFTYGLWKIFGIAICFILLILVIHYFYSLICILIKNRKFGQKNVKITKNTTNHSSFNKIFCEKIKYNLWKYRHFFVWLLLYFFSRLIISLVIWLLNIWWPTCNFSMEENYVLSMRPRYSLLIFSIASMLIMFCFGNKFIRNLWIFVFILWVFFILMWRFISLWCVWMENEEDLKEMEEIENVGEVEDIKEIETFWGLKTLELD